MTLVLSDTSTHQGLVEIIKFETGQDSLSNEEVIRAINLALDNYSYLELIGSRRWKPDASTNTDLPIATTTLNAGETSIALDTSMLTLEEIDLNGDILTPIDRSEFKDKTPTQVYGTSGTPQAYDYVAGQLFFYPPLATGTATVTAHFGRAEPYFATTDTTATIPIPRIHHRYLIADASEQIAFAKNDPDYNKFLNRKMTEEGKVLEFFGLRDQDTRKSLRTLIQDNK